jgi:hypothetical protein
MSREAMGIVRSLHAADPAKFTTPVLADRFEVSPESIRRILKSTFVPTPQKLETERLRKKQSDEEYHQEKSWLETVEMESLRDKFKQSPTSSYTARPPSSMYRIKKPDKR